MTYDELKFFTGPHNSFPCCTPPNALQYNIKGVIEELLEWGECLSWCVKTFYNKKSINYGMHLCSGPPRQCLEPTYWGASTSFTRRQTEILLCKAALAQSVLDGEHLWTSVFKSLILNWLRYLLCFWKMTALYLAPPIFSSSLQLSSTCYCHHHIA